MSSGRPPEKQIRTTHRYGFRSGEWATLLTMAPAPDKRDCYVVRFEDGVTDFWVVDDPNGEYEFRESGLGPSTDLAIEANRDTLEEAVARRKAGVFSPLESAYGGTISEIVAELESRGIRMSAFDDNESDV